MKSEILVNSLFNMAMNANATLSPNRSPTVKRKSSSRRDRAGSHLPPPTQEAHDAGLHAIRNYLKAHNSYDAFPVSFRLIVLDTKLNVKKALQCLLLNGKSNSDGTRSPRVG
jgi:5'-AMP-activated protein kinase regulatory gamma subunit